MTTTGKPWKLLLSGLAFLVLSSPVMAQGKGGWSQDPAERFKKIANGKDHIVIAELDAFMRGPYEQYAKDNNITDGKMNLDQYLKYSEERKKKFLSGGFTFGGGKFGPPGGATGGNPMFVKPGDKGPPAKPGDKTDPKNDKADPKGDKGDKGDKKGEKKEETPEEFEARVLKETENYFKHRDQNQDGFLNPDEMSGTLRENYKKFDKNNDGLISFDECKDYIRAYLKGEVGHKSMKGGNSGGDQKPGTPASGGGTTEITINLEGLDERPEVFTGTKLPPGLPAWFAELDTDKDGQIGLYEWVSAKKSIEEFKSMDRNGDNFLTPDEVLYFMQTTKEANAVASAAEDGSPGSGPAMTQGESGKTDSGKGKSSDKGKKGGFKFGPPKK